MLQTIRQTVAVAWMLAKRTLLAEARASRLSLLWPLIYPVAYTALFMALKPVMGGSARPALVYALHVFIGLSLWQLWLQGLQGQMRSVKAQRSLLSRADLSPSSLFLSGFLVEIVYLAPRLLLALVAAVLVLGFPGPVAVLVFLAMSVIVVLNGCVLGFVLQPFSTLMPDVAKAVQSVSLALMVTGGIFVVFPADLNPSTVTLLSFNPLAPLVHAARSPLLGEPSLFGWAAMAWLAVTFAALVLQARVARKVLPVLLERVGG